MSVAFWKKKPEEPVARPPKIIEFGAGLGDVIVLMYTSDRYNCLERLDPLDHATVVLMCHNPYVNELFQWHPKKSQLDIRDLGFWWPKDDAERRAFHKLPPAQPFIYQLQESCTFYPSPDDLSILNYLRSIGPYVVVAASAGGIDRNIPESICDQAVDLAIKGGYSVVVVGRTYGENRSEVQIRPRSGMSNMVDVMSVPGTASLLDRSVGIFCSHSAICLLSWRLKKPVFLLYPEHVRVREFHSSHQYTFGKDYATTRHMEFSQFTRERFSEFLSMLGNNA